MRQVFSESLEGFEGANVRLYGSRTDPKRRGGDIDLLVHIPGIGPEPAFKLELELGIELQDALGEQRIDVKVTPAVEGPDSSAFIRLVAPEALQIWP